MALRVLLSLGSLLILAACGKGEKETAVAPPTAGDDVVISETTSKAVPWAIATANPHATEAGARILAQGGSAVDAAIAVQAVLGLVEPQSSGLGGGAFMIYYDAQADKVHAYDGREMAPASATPTMFLKDDGTPMGFYDAVVSGRSVGVPGALAMLDMAHKKHGTS